MIKVVTVRKKPKDAGERIEQSPVSLRMEKSLAEKLNDISWEKRTDRSNEIIKACEFYITSLTCPNCKTINDKKSNYCSICLTPLSDTAKSKERSQVLLEKIIHNDARYKKLLKLVDEIL